MESKWKKVTDEMPESDKDVYLYVPRFEKDYGDGVRTGHWDSQTERWYLDDTDSCVELYEVTHFMEWIKPGPPSVA